MFGKNKNKKVGLCVMVVTACLVLAGIWTVLATPETALAKKPGGGGGGGDQPCVTFDDLADDDVRSDDGTPYFHNKKEKITVKFLKLTNDSLYLQTNSTDKAGNGRGIFIDFGTNVTLAPGTVNEMVITTTDDALEDPRVLGVSATLNVGAHQDEFNFFDMMEEGSSNDNVNLRILVWFYFKDGIRDKRDNLLIRLAPNGTGTRICPGSDSVTVTYDGIVDELRQWRVETKAVEQGACISRMGADDSLLLTDVVTPGLEPGHIALNFGFTVTAAP